MIKVLLAFCIGALLVFAAYEVAGAERRTVYCNEGQYAGSWVYAEYEPGVDLEWHWDNEFAIEWHWQLERDPCGKWRIPAQMVLDNADWFEQYLRWRLGYDELDLTIIAAKGRGPDDGDCEWKDNVDGCAGGDAWNEWDSDEGRYVPARYEGVIWIVEDDGMFRLVTLAHELAHVAHRAIRHNDEIPEYSYRPHDWYFHRYMRELTLDFLGEDIAPWCAEHRLGCAVGGDLKAKGQGWWPAR